MSGRVLVVEDDEATRGAVRALLEDAGYECCEARVGAAVRRSSGLRAVNPLSGLPGNTTITEEIEARLARRESFALLYVDIDRFKEFNDHYGFARGDLMISSVAQLLAEVSWGKEGERFLGHLGGDDFVVLAPPEGAETRAAGSA